MARPTKLDKIIMARVEAAVALTVAHRADDGMQDYRICPAHAHLSPNYQRVCNECPPTQCAKLTAKGLADDGSPLPPKDRPICGAQTRIGWACGNKVVPGKTKCRFHGGRSTGPKTEEGRARIAQAQRERWARWWRERTLESIRRAQNASCD